MELAELEKKNTALREKNDALREQDKVLREENDALREQNKRLRVHAQGAEVGNVMASAIATQQSCVANEQKARADHFARTLCNMSELKDINQKVEDQRKTIDAFRAENHDIKEKLESQKMTIDALRAENEALRKENDVLRQDLENSKKNMTAMKEKLTKLEGENHEVNEKLTKLDEKLAKLEMNESRLYERALVDLLDKQLRVALWDQGGKPPYRLYSFKNMIDFLERLEKEKAPKDGTCGDNAVQEFNALEPDDQRAIFARLQSMKDESLKLEPPLSLSAAAEALSSIKKGATGAAHPVRGKYQDNVHELIGVLNDGFYRCEENDEYSGDFNQALSLVELLKML